MKTVSAVASFFLVLLPAIVTASALLFVVKFVDWITQRQAVLPTARA